MSEILPIASICLSSATMAFVALHLSSFSVRAGLCLILASFCNLLQASWAYFVLVDSEFLHQPILFLLESHLPLIERAFWLLGVTLSSLALSRGEAQAAVCSKLLKRWENADLE